MDAALLSRIQFGLTVGFHFIFAPLTIGLAWFIVWMMGRYKNTGSDLYRDMARFWIRVFSVTFAVGVATGITMEFQFGTNWAAYSRFVGDVFGTPLAIEALFAFFLESSFLALLIFGWNRVSIKTLWAASLMVAIGATLSALWILIANSWQQTPAGYHIVNGRAELTSLWAAALNSSTIPRFLHTVNAAIMTGAFFVLGMSAWFILRGRHVESSRHSLKAALLVGLVASVLQLGLGHYHAVQVAFTQPIKLAAYEGLFDTQRSAPLLIFGVVRPDREEVSPAIRIPGLLSLLVHLNLNGEVKGLKDFPKDEWPPLVLTFYPFHLMVAIGMYLIGFSALGVLLLWLKKLEAYRLYLLLAVITIPLPFIANELGWIATEVGRQPWVVYKVLKTGDAISLSVPASQILFSMILFGFIYALVFAAWITVLRREFRRGPGGKEESQGA